MSQLTLSFEPRAFDPDRKPDDRHDWLSLHPLIDRGKRVRETDWRCEVCGEHATVSDFTGVWIFFRPKLVAPPSDATPNDEEGEAPEMDTTPPFGVKSHTCEPREWQ